MARLSEKTTAGEIMKILKIKFKPNKKSADILFDDGDVLNFSSETILKYSLYENYEINEQKRDAIQFESERGKAVERALNWLSKGYRSEKELERYLRERKYNKEIQTFVRDKLKEYNFINDETLAKTYVEYSQKKMGKFQIKQKLYQKGISKALIDESINSLEGQDDVCYNLAVKKLGVREKTPDEIAKLSRYLSSKGFEWEVVSRALRKLKCDVEELI